MRRPEISGNLLGFAALPVLTYALVAVPSGADGALARRRLPGRARLDEHVVVTEQDRARAPARLAHPAAELGQLFVGIHHVALDRLERGLVVATVIERDPHTLQLVRSRQL